MKYLLFLLSIMINFSIVNGQDFAAQIKANAIQIKKLDSLNEQIYKALHQNRLVMVGEMHGTNEPAKFVTGLAELFANYGDSVQVGFEIPSETMSPFLKLKTSGSIYQSDFFSNVSSYGMGSKAWAEALYRLNNNPRIRLFFYDPNTEDYKYSQDRDSLMYLKIKAQIQLRPTWKTITLSGNIHNMLLPYSGISKTGHFLSKDTELQLGDKLCSLNHLYQRGSMRNNIGNGLELRQVADINSDFAKIKDFDDYLFLFPSGRTNNYSGIIFTRTVTAAEMVTVK